MLPSKPVRLAGAQDDFVFVKRTPAAEYEQCELSEFLRHQVPVQYRCITPELWKRYVAALDELKHVRALIIQSPQPEITVAPAKVA